jgi:hypothetical protein
MKTKSYFASLILTLIFGPLGLLYSSAWQAAVLLVVSIGLLATHTDMLIAVYALSVFLGLCAVHETNKQARIREELEERRHEELVRAARQHSIGS